MLKYAYIYIYIYIYTNIYILKDNEMVNAQWSITTNYQKIKLHQAIKQLAMLQKGFQKKI